AVGVTGAASGPHAMGRAEDAALTRSAIPVVVGPAATGRWPGLVLPNETLVGAGLLAHANVDPEPDGSVRGVPAAVFVGAGRLLPSIALSAARHGLGVERGE